MTPHEQAEAKANHIATDILLVGKRKEVMDNLTTIILKAEERDDLVEWKKGHKGIEEYYAMKAERDSYKAKAEALDCFQSFLDDIDLEKQFLSVNAHNGITILELYNGRHNSFFEAPTLLQAINAAKGK